MPVYVNRVLDLKKMKVIGFDMDYTLVRYNTEEFEQLTFDLAKEKLIGALSYPEEIRELKFDFNRAIVGLVIDKRNGYLLKVSRYGKVKSSYFGLKQVDFRTQSQIYQEMAIELRDPDFESLDTSFAISHGVLFSQLVQLKQEGTPLPAYHQISDDIKEAIDMSHRDGTIKSILINNFDKYVIHDPKVAGLLERYKDYDKKLMIITNSDYQYAQELLRYALDPYWKKHSHWQDVFDIVITLADKPSFFERPGRFLHIDQQSGSMTNYNGSVRNGIYQGGWFKKLQSDLQVTGTEILYIGDHIYGDVVSIKKRCNWRTALVLGDLEREISGLHRSKEVQSEIDELMLQKGDLEIRINELDIQHYYGNKPDKNIIDELFDEMDIINGRISELLAEYRKHFNPYWGQILRAGYEESSYADQVEKYACIYMNKVSDLYDYSPKTYFRPFKRVLPHELGVVTACNDIGNRTITPRKLSG